MVGNMHGLEEIFEVFHHAHSITSGSLDFEKGILQAIGYKEFYPFYQHMLEQCDNNYDIAYESI